MEKRKKILFLITQSEFGGAQRFIYTLLTNLNKDKYDILIAAGPEGDDKKGLLTALEQKGIKTKHLKNLRRKINPFFDFLALFEIIRIIKEFKPDTLFANSSKAGLLGSAAGRIKKTKKIIYRIGGWTFNDPWPKWKKKLYILIEKHSAQLKDYIINNNKGDVEQAKELKIKPKKELILIHNCIDIEKTDNAFLTKEKARKELNIQGEYIIGTIANFYPSKGLEYLIKAIPKILKEEPETRFVIIGDGKERKKIKSLIKKHNIQKQVILKGIIKDAYKYLKAFDVFVLPSVKEGFPWTAIEAMTAKIPIIATKVGALPYFIKNKENGILINAKSPKEISRTAIELIQKEELREKISENQRKTVEEKFNINKMVKEIEKIL
ncbi:MAG: glycosyltransferase [Candidatus Portnoybacteria bacterium]|nr:glycosyltransferase [Candidatus Portnoybacteria bacterium]